jgi:hypothetical protein
MSKRTLVIAVVCLAALIYLGISVSRPSGASLAAAASDGADASERSGADHAAAPTAAAAAEAAGTHTGKPADRTAALTGDERDTLIMYDEMRSAFEQHGTDCLRMGEAIELAVKAHTPTLERLRDQRDRSSIQEQAESNRRVEAAEGPRLRELRGAMEQAVAKCKHDPRLRDALRNLARLNSPRDAQPTQ